MRFRCILCGHPPQCFEFEADRPACPKCGANAHHLVFPLTDVHFLVLDPAGPIVGEQRRSVACERKREVLARHRQDEYSATDHPLAVTCPSCKGSPEWSMMVRTLFPSVWAEMQSGKEERPAPVVVDMGGAKRRR